MRLAVGITLFALALAACSKQGSDEENGEKAPTPLVAVRVCPIARGDAVQMLEVTGRTDVTRRRRVLTPCGGTVQSLTVLEGSVVAADEVLATVLTKESQSAIAGAEALVRNARTPDQKAEAEHALRLARETANAVPVVAPIGGVVASRGVNPGELVAENTELCTLVDLASAVFLADVPVRDLARIRPGMAARVHASSLGDAGANATVDAILPRADAQSQTTLVRLRFVNPSAVRGLRPDMAGTAEIITGIHKDALLVPARAVLRDDENGSCTVVVVTQDTLAHITPVETGALMDSVVEVSGAGLHPGMLVVTAGHYALADSTRVTVQGGEER